MMTGGNIRGIAGRALLRACVAIAAATLAGPAVAQVPAGPPAGPALNVPVGRGAAPPDFAGEWILQNDEDPGQPFLGDYLGVPFNDAGRMRSDTSAESIWGTPEYRCRPHSAPHQWRGLGGARILKDADPLSRDITTYRVQFWRSLDRPIYIDNRPHPPAYAPHSWSGFSTAQWQGNTLVVHTSHLKDGFLRRGGPQTSDLYTMTEYFTRHDKYMTVTQIVDDPVYMEEPYVLSTTYELDANTVVMMEACVTSAFGEGGGTDPHYVPHFLPGENTGLGEWLKDESWIPPAAVRGGAATTYPEYLLGSARTQYPLSRSAVSIREAVNAQSPRDGQVHVLPVQGNVYMLVADGTNITVSVGRDGALVVDTGGRAIADKVLSTIADLQKQVAANPHPNTCNGVQCDGLPGWASPSMNAIIASPAPIRPIRYVINTNASPNHAGGNEQFAKAGSFFARRDNPAAVIAHENALNQMQDQPGADALPIEAFPSDTYFHTFQKLSEYFNGEAVILYHEPDAITRGDSIVFFRHSEVISAGDLFSTVSYPVIDLAAGGSIQGVIDGLNHILDLAVSEYRSQGGTWIIPGRGRLSDVADVASYRNMLTMIRDRVNKLMDDGMTLQQVIAAKPTLDFDGRYGADEGEWTTAQFIEAVYNSLSRSRQTGGTQ
ncbi:MAG: MBL fold metallo-hydrolase [Nevskiaceae bacterium]|jgi:glyoxylase-like metal-dependent hydrolase (beta-lactamase superfamily II)|nr:MBL fold metallo-hydrolase [Nevskiaceae bacterium]